MALNSEWAKGLEGGPSPHLPRGHEDLVELPGLHQGDAFPVEDPTPGCRDLLGGPLLPIGDRGPGSALEDLDLSGPDEHADAAQQPDPQEHPAAVPEGIGGLLSPGHQRVSRRRTRT